MFQLQIHNFDSTLFEKLQLRALEHGRSPEDEAKAILEQSLVRPKNGSNSEVDAIYLRLKSSGKPFSDSVEILREDRNR